MIVAINRIRARTPEALDSLLSAFESRSRIIEGVDGFLGIEIWVDREALEAVIVSRWVDRESFDRWVNSEEFKRAHSRRIPGADELEANLSIYEVIEKGVVNC